MNNKMRERLFGNNTTTNKTDEILFAILRKDLTYEELKQELMTKLKDYERKFDLGIIDDTVLVFEDRTICIHEYKTNGSITIYGYSDDKYTERVYSIDLKYFLTTGELDYMNIWL